MPPKKAGDKRDARKPKQFYTVSVNRQSDGRKIFNLFLKLSKDYKLSEYCRKGVELLHDIKNEKWDDVFTQSPELRAYINQLILEKVSEISVQVNMIGMTGSLSNIDSIQLDDDLQTEEIANDDLFSSILSNNLL